MPEPNAFKSLDACFVLSAAFLVLHFCALSLNAESPRLALVKDGDIYLLENGKTEPHLVIKGKSPRSRTQVQAFDQSGDKLFYSSYTEESVAAIEIEIAAGRDPYAWVEGYEQQFVLYDLQQKSSVIYFKTYFGEYLMSPDATSFIGVNCDDASCDCCELYTPKTGLTSSIRLKSGVDTELISHAQAVWAHDSRGAFYWKSVNRQSINSESSNDSELPKIAVQFCELESQIETQLWVSTEQTHFDDLFVSGNGTLWIVTGGFEWDTQTLISIQKSTGVGWQASNAITVSFPYSHDAFLPTNDPSHLYSAASKRILVVDPSTGDVETGSWALSEDEEALAVFLNSNGDRTLYIRTSASAPKEEFKRKHAMIIRQPNSSESDTVFDGYRLDAVWLPPIAMNAD